jgi:hypothetical protein
MMTRRARLARALLLALAAGFAMPALGAAQNAATAVIPRDIYVGDVFHAVVRLDLPVGARAVVPDTLLAGDALEPAGRVEILSDTLAGGGTRLTALYPLTVWRTGPSELEPARIRILTDGGERIVTATFPSFEVTSVLPADTTGIEPKPAKDVLGGERIIWPWLLGGLILVLAALAFYLWRRRHRPRAALRHLDFDPRAAALAALADARGEQLARMRAWRLLYIELADALRFYAAASYPVLGRDRTTLELGRAMGTTPLAEDDARRLIALLEHADLVKFARRDADADTALADWRAARAWVESVHAADEARRTELEAVA